MCVVGRKCYQVENVISGTNNTVPNCLTKCANGGICIASNTCACLKGWGGLDCTTCVPQNGCVKSFCQSNYFYDFLLNFQKFKYIIIILMKLCFDLFRT